ncbi:MAG: amino acid ABC transporter permease [Actinomycetota bacterium]|nr:amino acid ABC transporter permease [Actinomycetota bacterium]
MTAPLLSDALGPRARRRSLFASVAAGVALVALLLALVRRFQAEGELDADLWTPLLDGGTLEFLGLGLLNTLKLAAAAMVQAVVLGGGLALGRIARSRPARWGAGVVVEFFRGFPLLLLILFAVFGLRSLGFDLPLFWSVAGALALYNGAVLAEIFRSGILSLDRGQGEAASTVGLTYWQGMRYVIVPQALRRMVPAIVSQLVTLLKDTSLAYFVQYSELLRRAKLAGSFDKNLLQVSIAVALVYIAVNFCLGRVAKRLEVRQRRRLGADAIRVTGGPEDLVVSDAAASATGRDR